MRTLDLLSLGLALCLGTGCSERFGTTDGTTAGGGDGGGDGGSDGGGIGGTLGAELPAVDEDLDQTGCEEVSGQTLPGGTVYFLGVYAQTTDGWEGVEEIRVFANDAWAPNEDCSIVWAASASQDDAGACGNCDLGLSISAQLDLSATTCPLELYEGDEAFSVTYGIDLTENATVSTWYFAESGTQFGSGYSLGTASAPTAVNYASDKTCWWF